MKQNIGTILIGIALIIMAALAAGFTVAWKAVRLIELRNQAISECGQIAASAGSGSFNGAVYKICVEDKKYETKIQ